MSNLQAAMDDGRAAAIIGAAPDANPFKPTDEVLFIAWQAGYENACDWTMGAADSSGRRHSNTAPLFLQLIEEVGRLIRGGAHDLLNGNVNNVAGLIMSQLAHRWGLRPANWRPGDPPPEHREEKR